MVIIDSKRLFQFWEYKVSHGSLLIRSPKTEIDHNNIDIEFYGISYIDLPRFLYGIKIENAEICLSMRTKHNLNVDDSNKLYTIESGDNIYKIIAFYAKVNMHDKDIFYSPFT